MLRHNLGYKLIGLAVAVVIWLYTNNSTEHIERVPLEVRNVGSGLLVDSKPRLVTVRIVVPRAQADAVERDSKSIAAYVSLRDKPAGTHRVPVNVSLPPGIHDTLSVTTVPKLVPISLESKIESLMKVEVQFADSTPIGYGFGVPNLSPTRVTVSGTASQVESVRRLVVFVETGPSSIDRVEGDFRVAAIGSGGRRIEGVTLSPEKVHLSLEVKEAPASRVVLISPDVTGQPAYPSRVASVSVRPQTVTVTGRPEQLMRTSTVLTEPVSVAGRTSGFSQRVRIDVPEGLVLSEREPVTVTVNLVTPPTPERPTPAPKPEPAEPPKAEPAQPRTTGD